MTSYKISTVQVPWDSIWVNLLRFIPQLLLREMMESSVPSALKSLCFHLLFLLTSQLLELSPELSSQLICFLDTFWFRFLYWKCAFILKREASRAEWLQIVWRGRWKAISKKYLGFPDAVLHLWYLLLHTEPCLSRQEFQSTF